MLKKINVKLGPEKNYNILIGYDILKNAGNYLNKMNLGKSIFIITSPRIASFYLSTLVSSLRNNGFEDIGIGYLPDGEKYKSWEYYGKMLKKLLNFNKTGIKNVFIINLGGGVIGDLGGFVSATFKRGIKYIQVPSTLISLADSGVGGKVGIDFYGTKNIVGAFYQPSLVYADVKLLKTLDKREFISGMAEVIKYGIIKDEKLFDFIEKNLNKILNLETESLIYIITKSYQIKAGIVQKDERDELGIRVILNYGHTIGHAIESASNYFFRHGEAISIGMVCANDIAVSLGILKQEISDKIENLLQKTGLPVKAHKCSLKSIFDYLKQDKKFINNINRFVLPARIGKVIIKENIPYTLLKKVISNRLV